VCSVLRSAGATQAQHGAANVAVYGSVARGDDTAFSDIDLLVDFLPGASLIDEFRLENELREFLAADVDVVARAGLKARDQHIRDEARTL
jgi:predicted nucleotidyltransferase